MRNIFQTDNQKFKPISVAGAYLHEKYGLVTSFLRGKLSASSLSRIAKPVVESNRVTWMGDFLSEMQMHTLFPEDVQIKTEKAYSEWLIELDRIRKGLQVAGDAEKKSWADLLGHAFNTKNNFLITDGDNWAIVWGWEFNNQLKFIPTDFLSQQPPVEVTPENVQKSETKSPEPATGSETIGSSQTNDAIFDDPEPPKNTEPPVPIIPPLPPAPPAQAPFPSPRRGIGFWESLKRFFRWLAYRFWGLMMLIIYTLLIICLCRKCICPVKEDCSQFSEVEKKLKHLQGRMEERCPEVDSTSSNPRP
jgi:hypothetical protein